MKILSDATTPFGRKCVVCAMERELEFEEVFVSIDDALEAANPLRQIPALSTGDGQTLYDSDVVVTFLDESAAEDPLIPSDGRYEHLTRMALANGMMESVLLRTMESRRPDGERSEGFIEKLDNRVLRAVASLEEQVELLCTDKLFASDIAIVCALEYADFRFTDTWRAAAPRLSAWHAVLAERPSFIATRPTRSIPV